MRTTEEIQLDESIRRLRLETFGKGFPFMIHDKEFAPDGFINEFPDGSMKIMTLAENNQTIIEVRSLNSTETQQIRKKHGLAIFQYA